MQKFKNDLKPYTNLQNYKQFLVPILIMFGIYLLGISSIIRADFSYKDDLYRAISGDTAWGQVFSRHISDILSMIINADTHLTDISPFTQILAALILAISSVILVYVICDKKISKLALIASVPLGLSPYFLQCISFKFDAPYMALSILMSVVPFLFTKNRIIFSVISIISILIMCLTYQASSGIYIMVVVILSFQYWLSNKKTYKEIFQFILIAAFSYCVTLLLFRILFVKNISMSYVSTDILSLTDIFPGIINNLKQYTIQVNKDFGGIWKVLITFIIICFIAKTTVLSKQNKIITFFISITITIALFITSFGVYLIFKDPFLVPRGMYGIGIAMAIFGIYTTVGNKKNALLSAIPAIALSWCFFIFALSYGNALSDQKRYNNFRTEILLHDLYTLFPNQKETLQIVVKGSEWWSPVTNNIAKRNHIIKSIVDVQLGEWGGVDGCYYLLNYYDFPLQRKYNIPINEFTTVLLESNYHTIKSNGKQVLVILK